METTTGPDYNRCKVCCQLVPTGFFCTCDLTRQNHIEAIRRRKRIDAGTIVPLVETLHDSDTQDAPIPMPSWGGWPRTLLICGVCIVLAALFCHATDGMSRAGHATARQWEAEQKAMEARR